MEIIVFILKLADSDHSKRRIILSKKQQIPIVTTYHFVRCILSDFTFIPVYNRWLLKFTKLRLSKSPNKVTTTIFNKHEFTFLTYLLLSLYSGFFA